MTFAEAVDAWMIDYGARRGRKLGIGELAAALGVGYSNIKAWRSGRIQYPHPKNVEGILSFFHAPSIGDFLQGPPHQLTDHESPSPESPSPESPAPAPASHTPRKWHSHEMKNGSVTARFGNRNQFCTAAAAICKVCGGDMKRSCIACRLRECLFVVDRLNDGAGMDEAIACAEKYIDSTLSRLKEDYDSCYGAPE